MTSESLKKKLVLFYVLLLKLGYNAFCDYDVSKLSLRMLLTGMKLNFEIVSFRTIVYTNAGVFT